MPVSEETDPRIFGRVAHQPTTRKHKHNNNKKLASKVEILPKMAMMNPRVAECSGGIPWAHLSSG
jgi:hypothetical protein